MRRGRSYWKVNVLGITIYVILTAWLLLASASAIASQVIAEDGTLPNWRATTGLVLGLLALVGMGWGRDYDDDGDEDEDDDRPRRGRRRARDRRGTAKDLAGSERATSGKRRTGA